MDQAESTDRSAAIFKLPPDVQQGIAGLLDGDDRANFALSCKAFQPLILAGQQASVSGEDGRLLELVHAFNGSLAKHPNNIKSLCILSNKYDGSNEPPAPLLPPLLYGRLQSLCSLTLELLVVNLEGLGCLRPQLQRLKIECCSLSGAAAAIFAHSWPRLEALSLKDCTIDADLGAVALPRVTHLTLSNVYRAGQLYECAGLFSLGCPQCTHLYLGPCLPSPAAACRGFSSLQSVEVSWDPVELRKWDAWPGPVPELDLPATVGSLTCTMHNDDFTSSMPIDQDHLDLYALLEMAGRIIRSGGQLRELCLPDCATFVRKLTFDDDGEVLLMEPSEQEVASVYRPVCRSLHGLTVLDLSGAPQCGLQVVTEVVRSAPDLKDVRLRVPSELFAGHRHVSTIPCSRLKHLKLSRALVFLGPRVAGRLLDLANVLEDARSLDCITVGLTAALLPLDRVTLRLTCRTGCVIECSVSKVSCWQWKLHSVLEAAPGHLPARHALVTFCWDADRGWVSSVSYA